MVLLIHVDIYFELLLVHCIKCTKE